MLNALLNSKRLSIRIPRTNMVFPVWQWLPAVLCGVIIALLPYKLGIVVPVGVVGVCVLLAVLEYPLLGMAAVLFLGPLGAFEETFIGGPIGSITSGQLMLFFTLFVWGIRNLKNGRIVIPWTPLNIPILVFVLTAMFSLWYAVDIMPGIREMVKWIEILLLMWLMLDLTREYKPRTVLIITLGLLLSAGLVQGLYGVYQFAIAGSGPWHFAIGGRLFRAVGTFMQPNPYGGYMALNAFLSIGLLIGMLSDALEGEAITLQTVIERVKASRWLQLVIVLTMVMMVALIGSWSRGAWINFAAGMAFVTLLTPKSMWDGIKLIAFGIAAFWVALQVGLVPAAFSDRMFGFISQFGEAENLPLTAATHSLLERLAHWTAGLNMMQDKLWLGHGFGNYEVVYLDYRVPGPWLDALGHAHNYYINIMAEMGIVGLIAYLFMWGGVFWLTIRVIYRAAALERGVAIGMLGAWVGMAVHHMLDNMYVKNIYLHMGVMFALLVMLDMRSSARSVWNQKRRERRQEKQGWLAKLENYVGD